MSSPSRTYPPDLAELHEDTFAGLADERHVVEHGAVVAVFELCPYPPVRLGGFDEGLGGWLEDGAAGDVEEEAGTEEDGEDA